jgi:exopolysaccharide biosynthesis polyprenyl glycosylphosphotransferase
VRRPYDGGPDLTRRKPSAARIASGDPDRAVPDWARRFSRDLAITDALSIGWAAVGVQVVRIPGIDSHPAIVPPNIASIALTVGTAVLWFGALQLTGSRDHRFIGLGAIEYKRVARATLSVYGSLALCSYAFDLQVPRQYVLVMMPVGLIALLLSRFLWRRWLHLRRSSGEMMTRVLAVGDQRTVNDLVRDLRRAPMSGYVVVGACVPAGTECSSVDIPIAGDLAHVVSTVQRIDVDAVAVTASGAFGGDDVRRLGWELEDTTAELMLAPALTNIAGPRIHTQPVAGLPLIHVARPTYHAANQLLKRSLDLLLASLLLVLLLPVFVVTAIAIKVGSPGPVFFRQVRAGLGGSTFRILKFRSMVPDAELRLTEAEYRARDAGNEVMFKVRNDPRVTAVGRFIRRYSIDELPQLLNVIAGSMSLVGPRPPLMREIELYGADARRRLLVKPGMTGLWQVSGRSDLTWDDTVRLDMYYIENWSLTVDLVILWKTAKAVLAPEGAY